jgi:hypothetical protein
MSSNFELKGKIENKNQIHKRVQNKNKIKRMRTKYEKKLKRRS